MSEFTGSYKSRDGVSANPVNRAAIGLRLAAEEEYKDGSLDSFRDAVERLHLLAFPRFRRRDDIEPPEFVQKNPDDESDQMLKTDLGGATKDQLRDLLNKYAILFEELEIHGSMRREYEEDEMGRRRK